MQNSHSLLRSSFSRQSTWTLTTARCTKGRRCQRQRTSTQITTTKIPHKRLLRTTAYQRPRQNGWRQPIFWWLRLWPTTTDVNLYRLQFVIKESSCSKCHVILASFVAFAFEINLSFFTIDILIAQACQIFYRTQYMCSTLCTWGPIFGSWCLWGTLSENKLASLVATLVRNYDPPTYSLTHWQG